MFGAKAKIAEMSRRYEERISSLESENASLMNRIHELENTPNEVYKDYFEKDVIELLMQSYENGVEFLQRTIEDNISDLQ